MAKLKITALGSSFAAGPGIEPTIDKNALRSGRNYVHQLAEKLENVDLTDLTVSGATLLNVLNEPQTTRSGATFPPQLDHLPPNTDIVTLTGGGNDLGYIGSMANDSMINSTGPLRYVLQSLGMGSSPALALTADDVAARFVEVIDKIKELAPSAKVYLVEYLSVVSPATTHPWSQDIPLNAGQIEHYYNVAGILRAAYGKAAQARPEVVLIEAAKASQGHEVGSSEPWMEGLNLTMVAWSMWTKGLSTTPYHPNLAGHTAVADMIYRRIVEDRRA